MTDIMIGGLDVGTTGCKIALFDGQANLIKTYYSEYDAKHAGGKHEIDFNDVKNGVLSLLSLAASEYKISALGVTSFGETFAMLDENDDILAPSMLYTDPRGQAECDAISLAIGKDRLTLLTGVKPHPMYSIPKIAWWKNNAPEIFARCKRILLGEDFIVYLLTGVAQIDYALAARTAAFDIEKKEWIDEVFAAAGVDVSLMSKPVAAGTVAGTLRPELKKSLGIDYDITIVNAAHDQVSAMIGSGVFSSDQAMDGTGTVECIPVILNEKPDDLDFYGYGYSVVPYLDGRYAVYALSFTGGATLKWFRDNFAELERAECEKSGKNVYAELDSRVKDSPSDILVLPHFAGAATPYMDNDSKAAFVGVTLETDKIDLYKALMEGTSYEMLLNFNMMKSFTGEISEIRATGGGAASDVWLQIKADILGTAITALAGKEIGALGTAALAGVAIGAYPSLAEAVSVSGGVRKVFRPSPEKSEEYAKLYKKYEGLYKAVKSL